MSPPDLARPAPHNVSQARRSLLSRRQALGLIAACGLVGPGRAMADAEPPEAPLAPDIAAIRNRGELVFALNSVDTYPFFYLQDGELKGSDIRLAEELAATLKVRATFNRATDTFDGVVDLVALGEADVGFGKIARTLSRLQKAVFTNAYMRIGHALLINRLAMESQARGETLSYSVRHFHGKLAVLGASAWVEFGQLYFPGAELVAFPTWAGAVEATKRGDVVAAYRDEYEVRTILRMDPSLALTLRTVTFGDVQSNLSMAVNRNSNVLLAYINEFLSQRVNEPTVDDMLRSLRSRS